MAQTENTAVNRLIELAQNKPLALDDDADDLFGDPAERARRKAAEKAAAEKAEQDRIAAQRAAIERAAAARAAAAAAAQKTAKTPPLPFRQSGSMEAVEPLPATRAAKGTVAPQGTPAPETLAAIVPSKALDHVSTKPFDQIEEDDEIPIEQEPEPVKRTLKPLFASEASSPEMAAPEVDWYRQSDQVEALDEVLYGTEGVRRGSGASALWWVAGAFALGLGVAALFFWPTKKPAKAAPAAAAEVAPVEPVAASGAAPAIAAPTLVTIHFESNPPGATVVLVQNGTTTPLGTTPVDAQVDPSKRYEAMFSMENHASVILPVDAASSRVAATLASTGGDAAKAAPDAPQTMAATTPPAEPAVATTPVPEPAVAAEPIPEPAPAKVAPSSKKSSSKAARADKADKVDKPDKADRPAKKDKKVAKAGEPAKAASKGGEGVLMLAAKPPCEILIDGKKTGLTTPQRDLGLSPGKHTITLVNREHRIQEKFSVTIKPSQATRVVKDLTSRMK